MEVIPFIEVNVDTVYIRTNVEQIEEEGFTGLKEYDEIQMSKDEFIALIGIIDVDVAELFFDKMILEADVAELWYEFMKGAE